MQVVTEAGTQIILDCGTGVRELGLYLSAHLAPPVQASLLLSHTHWDHIQGIPFFTPAYLPGNSFRFYAARGMNKQVGELLAGQMDLSYFPVRLDQLRAEMSYFEVGEEVFQVGEAMVQARYLNHTTLCLGYRIVADGACVAYATDHEPYTTSPLTPGDEAVHAGDRGLIEFARGADLLIHDAQYTDQEYPAKVGWGHSTARYASSIAVKAGVSRLGLFHHDPAHSDELIDRHVEHARQLLAEIPSAPEVFAAAEGQEIALSGAGSAEPGLVHPMARPERKGRRPRVLVADDDRLTSLMIQDALREEGYELLVASDGEQALALALAELPDLVLLDGIMPKATGFQVCARLRQEPATRDLPIIMLTALDDPQNTASGFKEGASDYIAKPFTRSVLQSRVRSWLARSGVL